MSQYDYDGLTIALDSQGSPIQWFIPLPFGPFDPENAVDWFCRDVDYLYQDDLLVVGCTVKGSTKEAPGILIVHVIDIATRAIQDSTRVNLNNVDGKGNSFFFTNKLNLKIVNQNISDSDITAPYLFIYDSAQPPTQLDALKQTPDVFHAIGFTFYNAGVVNAGLFRFKAQNFANGVSIIRLDMVDSMAGQVYVSVNIDKDSNLRLMKCDIDFTETDIPCSDFAIYTGKNLLLQSGNRVILLNNDNNAVLYSLDDPEDAIDISDQEFFYQAYIWPYRADGNNSNLGLAFWDYTNDKSGGTAMYSWTGGQSIPVTAYNVEQCGLIQNNRLCSAQDTIDQYNLDSPGFVI